MGEIPSALARVIPIVLVALVALSPAAAAGSPRLWINWQGQFLPDVGVPGGGAGFGWSDAEVITVKGITSASGELTLTSKAPTLAFRDMVLMVSLCGYKGRGYCEAVGPGNVVTTKMPATLAVDLAMGKGSADGILITVMPASVAGTRVTTVESFTVTGVLDVKQGR